MTEFLGLKRRIPLPPRPTAKAILLAWLGSFLAIGSVGLLAHLSGTPLVLGSFGASCVLLFGFPEAPFSQPRNVILGHVLSSLVGLVFLAWLGPSWWSTGLALATAIALMLATRTVHPPAGSNPVIVMLADPGWSFLAFPTALGAVLLVLAAFIFHGTVTRGRYPGYWV